MEHYLKRDPKCFTAKYNIFYLLYFEETRYVNEAIAREHELKDWSRKKKMQLINTMNPGLNFLNAELFGKWPPEDISFYKRF